MLTELLKRIRKNPEIYQRGFQKRGIKLDLNSLLELDKEWRALLGEIEFLRAEQNRLAKKKDFSQDELERGKAIKQRLKELEKELKEKEEKLDSLLFSLPNLPLETTPLGEDESKNRVIKEVGKKPKFNFSPKDYLTLVEDKWIDIKRAAKVSGTRFGYLKNEAVLLEYALVNWVIKKLLKKGFTLIIPPALITFQAMKGMGYIDREKDFQERYYLPQDNLFLIGTAEQAIGPMHMNEIFEEKELPKRYLAFSPCFRREAGSYGKETKGIWRVHYFEKLEMFSFTRAEDSLKEHQFLLGIEEELMQELKIPYRVIEICTGDLAPPAAASYDIEAWLPGQNRYGETHSCSNCTDFQSQRLNIRYRSKEGLKFVHTLNATAFAIGRILIAIIENYQQKDGSIKIPQVLSPYFKDYFKNQ